MGWTAHVGRLFCTVGLKMPLDSISRQIENKVSSHKKAEGADETGLGQLKFYNAIGQGPDSSWPPCTEL